MENKTTFWWQSPIFKIAIISFLALMMLIPLGMIRSQVNERSANHTQSVSEITSNWGTEQTLSGPTLLYEYQEGVIKNPRSVYISPDSVKYIINTTSQKLHRSIYDVSVYTADITIQGSFTIDTKLPELGCAALNLSISDLKGLQGYPTIFVGGQELKIRSEYNSIKADVELPEKVRPGDILPFTVSMIIKGSEALNFSPVGKFMEVQIASDYPAPSFSGDFLPVERDVRSDGFTAKWIVTQLMVAPPSCKRFGVNLMQPVTQYRQTERATKYGILIIFLIFIAGFVVEMISKKPINIIQYLVIGASLVLFYSLLLAFSDFLSFGLSYLIASVMTVSALGAYFIGIVKNKWAYLLPCLVALFYGVIYILLQMETFAFLAGTLLLFIILCVIMALTRNMMIEGPRTDTP